MTAPSPETVPGLFVLGKGILSWDPEERRLNRYGTVRLWRRFVPFDASRLGPPMSTGEMIVTLSGEAAAHGHDALTITTRRVRLPRFGRDGPVAFPPGAPYGAHGELVAVVLQARPAEHAGDSTLGIRPQLPEAGERIVLGDGILFYGDLSDGARVSAGVRPRDPDRWKCYTYGPGGSRPAMRLRPPYMDVRALYRAVEQTVRLEFEPRP